MFGPVVTTKAHLALSGARTHSNNTAEMTAMIEAFSFGPRGPVTHDESHVFFYSMHAAGICLGTIQDRPHVELALACQQSMIRVQHRLRLTMQHVYGHSGNLGIYCSQEIKYLFSIVQRLILENFDEIMIVKITDSNYPSCAKVKISDPQVIEWAKVRVYVFSYSVLCFGKIAGPTETVDRWTGQLHDCHKDVSEQFYGIDGERIEFRVEHFPRTYVIGTASKDSGVFGKQNIHPEKFVYRIIFTSMFHDIIWDKKIMIRNAFQIPKPSGTMRRNLYQLIGHSLDLEVKTGGMTLVSKPGGKWNSVVGQMPQRFVETGHPASTRTSSLNRGVVKRKNNRNTIHINAESPNVEL